MKKLNIVLSVILIIVILIFSLIVIPFISYWLSYFSGWIASLTIGVPLSNSLNDIFNTQYFTSERIPELAALLGWIGGFFKTSLAAQKIYASIPKEKEK